MRKYEVSINKKQYSVVVKKYTQSEAELEINGKPYSVKLDAPITAGGAPVSAVQNTQMQQPVQQQPVQQQPVQQQPVQQQAAQAPAATPAPAPGPAASPAPAPPAQGGEVIKAPIPGSILEILVNVGDSVSAGQTVFKMEAMKMENDVNAIGAGVVKSISVSVGDAVNQGQDLMVIG